MRGFTPVPFMTDLALNTGTRSFYTFRIIS